MMSRKEIVEKKNEVRSSENKGKKFQEATRMPCLGSCTNARPQRFVGQPSKNIFNPLRSHGIKLSKKRWVHERKT